eukprot:4228020-Prymnesium_polylepis.3
MPSQLPPHSHALTAQAPCAAPSPSHPPKCKCGRPSHCDHVPPFGCAQPRSPGWGVPGRIVALFAGWVVYSHIQGRTEGGAGTSCTSVASRGGPSSLASSLASVGSSLASVAR